MRNYRDADAREAAKLLAMLVTVHMPEAYLNDNCLPRAP
jgi:hypothetical protein